MRAPDYLIIHLGGNDLGTEKTYDTCSRLRDAIRKVLIFMPHCKVVWSEILARRCYTAATFQTGMDSARKKVNKKARSYVRGLNGYVIRHTNITDNHIDLYRRHDVVHLSQLGNRVFLDNLYNGINFILNSKSGCEYIPA